MMSFGAKLSAVLTLSGFLSTAVFAVDISDLAKQVKEQQTATGSEYTLTHLPGEILIPVNLLGAVGRPGLYHVPKNTDLIRLIVAAGGLNREAESDDITIKRRFDKQETIINVEFDDQLAEPGRDLIVLEAEDIINVPYHEPIISHDSQAVIGVVASVISIVLSAMVLQKAVD